MPRSVGTPPPTLMLGRIVLLALLHGLLWAAIVPPWQVPDEPKHMEFIRLMRGRGPIAFSSEQHDADPALQAEIVASMETHRFWWFGRAPGYDPEAASQRFTDLWAHGAGSALARTSPVYHWLAARLQPEGLLAGLYAARLFSVLAGASIVLLAGITARELFPNDPLVRYGAPLFLALHPMFAFVHAGANNDALVNVLAALSFLLAARVLARGATASRLALLALVVVAAVAVKRVAVVLVPPVVLAVAAWRARTARRPAVAFLGALAAMAAAGLAALWWWFGAGVALLPQQWRWNLGQYFFNDPEQVERILAYARTPGVGAIVAEYAARVHNGFWGSFGWALLEFPLWLYGLLALAAGVAAAGALRRALFGCEPHAARYGLLVSATAVAVTWAAAVAFFLGDLNRPYPAPPQGRYLFVSAVPLAVLLTAGWSAWLAPALRGRALLALAVAMAALDAVALAGVIAWYYAG